MTAFLSTEQGGSANQTAIPVGYRPRGNVVGGRLKRLRSTITFASQASGDTIALGNLPAGSVFAYGVMTTDTSTGTATVAVGVSGTAAKYKAAATFTSTDTPTLFGKAAPIAASDAGLAADEAVIATVGTAALPASGTMVIDLFYSSAN